jgi:hypothetical protein
MKIVVTSSGRKNNRTFTIEVLDGQAIIHTEAADGVKKRDEVVWKLADLYGALDIEMIEAKPAEFKFTEIPSIPVLEETEADDFFEDNQEFVYARILQAVEEGIRAQRDSIRLFELNGTGVYITSDKDDWKNGVQQSLEYFIAIEQYDKCIIARQILQKL